jgi:HK97 family phage major capsid protein
MAPSGYGTPSGGAVLTQEQVEATLIQPLSAASVVLDSDPRIFDSRGGVPLRIPKITAIPLADPWRSENVQIAEVDPTYGELTLLPSSLKSLKVLHRFSNELARHSVVSIATALRDAFVAQVAGALDKAFLIGDGSSNTILGIANQSGVQVTATTGTPTVDMLHDAEGKLLNANANPATSVWYMHPRDLISLRKQREGAGSGQYLIQPDPTEAGKYTLLGHQVAVTTAIPANGGAGTNESTIIFADMQQVAVGRDLDMEVTLLDQTYGEYDQLALRIVTRWDIGLLNAPAVVVLRGVTP